MSAETRPYVGMEAITPHATNPLPKPCNGLWCNADGTADITTLNGDVLNGFPLLKGRNDIQVSHVRAIATMTAIYAGYTAPTGQR